MSSYAVTVRYGLNKINYMTPNWHTEEHANLDLIDSLFYSIQTSGIPFAIDAGTTNNIVVNYSPAFTAYTLGMQISGKFSNTNSGAVTINVNGLGAKNVLLNGAAVTAGLFEEDMYFRMIYDGTQFLTLDPIITTTVVDNVTPSQLSTGHPTWDTSGNLTDINNITGTGTSNFSVVRQAGKQGIFHAGAYTSGNVTVSASAPSGGNDGDIWLKV